MNEVAETPAAAAAATPGQRLKAARERRGLSSQKAADQMHLDHWVIEALESDEFDKIGPSVYAKGHLKHYAGMLGLPTAEIMAAYGAPAPAAPAPQPGSMRMRTQEPVGIELPWATIAAAVVIAGLVWLRPWRGHAVSAAPAAAGNHVAATAPAAAATVPAATAAADAAASDASPAAASAEDLVDDAQDAAMPTAGAAKAAAGAAKGTGGAAKGTGGAAAVALSAEPAAAAIPGGGKARLRLSFSADSRVEVYDAAGKPVFAGNGRANSVKTVGGDAPLRVYLGFAGGVQLAINNHVIAIGPQFLAGDAARFEAGADGVLRRDTHSPARPHG